MPAPLDTAYCLPDDWIERTLSFRPGGPLEPLVQKLQEAIAQHRERAITSEHIQELALLACGLKTETDSFLAGTFKLLRRLSSVACGNWVVENPLEERNWTCKTIHQIAKDLDSIWAEWLVLERLVDLGWVPVESPRSRGTPDWLVWRASEISVEVKHKHALGSGRHRLTWFLRGFSFLPAHQFLKRYSWDWSAPDNLRDRDVEDFLDGALALLPSVELRLQRDGADQEFQEGSISCLVDNGAIEINWRSLEDKIIVLNGRPRYEVTGECFNPGSIEVGWRGRREGDDDRSALLDSFGRLTVQDTADLVCIVWPVPWLWQATEEWIEQTVEMMEVVWGARAGALWPLGWSSSDSEYRWFLNERAKELLTGGRSRP